MYFISCIKLYINDKSNSKLTYIGIAIFVGTISYMISAISNDSSITVAPVFWAVIGVGIAVNQIVKQNNLESKILDERK